MIVLRPGQEEPPPPDRDWQPRHIMVALDGSPLSEAGLRPAAEIAKLTGADLTLLRVVEPIPVLAPDGLIPQPTVLDSSLLNDLKDQAREYLEALAGKLRKDRLSVTCRVVIGDRTAPAILEEAKESDLTVLATHARHGVARALLGSVADKLVRGATGPVLVVHPESPNIRRSP
jgi:nucleotide-binding universal stress UspA family protein